MADVVVRRAGADDLDAIVSLAGRALGWRGDARDRDFFAWKHSQNAFGESPAWVALDGDRIVGFRTLMRWEFARRGERLRVVRAVDTASDPEYQGRGIFRKLTLHAVEELTAEGLDAVFNTPNDQSRPGYLKMGWVELGRPSLGIRPHGPAGAVRMSRSRRAAEKWSEPTAAGDDARDVLGDASLDGLLAALPANAPGWSTKRTPEFLRWRYGFEPLHYRVFAVREGLAIFRVRRRGPSREVALCEWLSPSRDTRALARIARAGDYLVAAGLGARAGLIPVPNLGPIVTWRALARPDVPRLAELQFTLGDLELF